MTTNSISTPSFDAVICVGVKDLFIVKKVVKYVQMNISPRRIFLIMNRRFFKMYSTSFRDAYNVALIDETEIVDGMDIKCVRDAVNQHFTNAFRGGGTTNNF
jgi:hypothetical protein